MNDLIAPKFANLIFIGSKNPEIEEQLTKFGQKNGIGIVLSDKIAYAPEAITQTKNVIGIILAANDPKLVPALISKNQKIKVLDPRLPIHNLINELQKITASYIPEKFPELVEAALGKIIPAFFKNMEPITLESCKDYSVRYSHLVACDLTSSGFWGKAFCEVEINNLRRSYNQLRAKSDIQLIDLFGEMCNQFLGLVSVALKEIGLDPQISLPNSVKLKQFSGLNQTEFAPTVLLSDPQKVLSVGITVRVKPNSGARWKDLDPNVADSRVVFL